VINGQNQWPPEIVEKDESGLIYGKLEAPAAQKTLMLEQAGSAPYSYFTPARTAELQGAGVAIADGPASECPCGKPSKLYSIIVQGYNSSSFEKNTDNIHNAAVGMGGKNNNSDRGGASDNTIYIGQPTNTGSDVDYDTSKARIKKAFENVKAKMQCCDKLFVYVTGHGGLYCKVTWENRITGAQSEEKKETECPKVGDTSWGIWRAVKVEKDTYMTLDGEWLWGEELGQLLNTIDSCNMYIYLQACHSAGAMDWLKGKGRTIGTSADEDLSSWGREGIGSDTTNAFIKGLNGEAGSDLNGDGKTSIEEAMQHAQNTYAGKTDASVNSNPQYWRSTEECRCPEEICGPPGVAIGDGGGVAIGNGTRPANDTVGNGTVAGNGTVGDGTAEGIGDDIFGGPGDDAWQYADADNDGVVDFLDNCVGIANANQADSDGDGEGNACDACPQDRYNDIDHDGLCENNDNCDDVANSDQTDTDGDYKGDACDVCPEDNNNDIDNDGVCGNWDNCPYVFNPNQADNDNDGYGSACDETPVNCQNEMDPEYASVVAQGSTLTQSACQALLEGVDQPECFTTCAYAGYESWTWGSNTYACCYQDVNRYACSDCPGENPVCPDPNTVCTGANGPE
jgi:hypothetical protein